MEKKCTVCQKTFEQNQNVIGTTTSLAVGRDPENERCYGCVLDSLTGGRPPEEGDFNSARLASGEMSDKEWRWLQEDLRAVETGRSIREVEEAGYIDDWCDVCGSICWCHEEDDSEE